MSALIRSGPAGSGISIHRISARDGELDLLSIDTQWGDTDDITASAFHTDSNRVGNIHSVTEVASNNVIPIRVGGDEGTRLDNKLEVRLNVKELLNQTGIVAKVCKVKKRRASLGKTGFNTPDFGLVSFVGSSEAVKLCHHCGLDSEVTRGRLARDGRRRGLAGRRTS